jgi:hypothetical protein
MWALVTSVRFLMAATSSLPCLMLAATKAAMCRCHAAQEAVVEHADRLLPLLAALTACQLSAEARLGALQTLTSLALELPRNVRWYFAVALW